VVTHAVVYGNQQIQCWALINDNCANKASAIKSTKIFLAGSDVKGQREVMHGKVIKIQQSPWDSSQVGGNSLIVSRG